MGSFNGDYIINKIRNLVDNSIHEREIRRRGQKVHIPFVEINKCMILMYNESLHLRTSLVKDIKETDDVLQVFTMNTLYEFKKVKDYD